MGATGVLWAAALCLLAADGALSQRLPSLMALEELLDGEYELAPGGGSVSVVETADGESVPICYLPYLFAFTPIYPGEAGSYENVAVIALAMEHLNAGNGEIVPELDGLDERCPLRFVSEVVDTGGLQKTGVDEVIKLTAPTEEGQLQPCAILGASYSSNSIPTSIISGLRGIPQVSPISTSSQLDDKEQFRLFGRTIPHDGGTALSLLAKLRSWNVGNLAVLHVDDTYGSHFANEISLAAEAGPGDMRVSTAKLIFEASDEAIARAVQILKETEARYFFGVVYSEDIDRIMTEAHRQGVAGTGRHVWLFSDGVGSDVALRDFERGSPLEEAYRGTSVLAPAGGVPGVGMFDRLLRSVQALGEAEEDRAYVDSLLPVKTAEDAEMWANYSVSELDIAAPFLYDAAVGLGLAACGLATSSPGGEGAGAGGNFSGEELYRAFLNTTFAGASGEVILDSDTGTRTPASTLYSLVNFVDEDADDAGVEPGSVRFRAVTTDLFQNGQWESKVPYTFNDGSNEVPPDLPELVMDENHLTTGMKAVGLIFCGITVVLSLGFSVWTRHFATKTVVRASQPFFLYFITAGTALMGLSLIPLSIDLGVTDQKGANAACISFPWLLTAGFSLTFSALFTKTMRIYRIMKMASRCIRMELTPLDVVKPMVVLLLLNIAVLTVWTVWDPLERQTDVMETDQFDRVEESSSVCRSEHSDAFIVALCVINLGSLLFSVFQAYRARNLSTEYQESQYIFMAMALNMVMALVGIPVLIMTRDNTAALYFVSASLIFVVSNSILLLVFIPKVGALWEKMRNGDTQGRSSQRYSLTSISSWRSFSGGSHNRDTLTGNPTLYGANVKNMSVRQAELEEENRNLRKKNRELAKLLTEKTESSNLEEGEVVKEDDRPEAAD